jgi:hypothetical protein
MPTVFESISDGFYTAFFEPDLERRRGKIEAWIKESIPLVQSAVENEFRACIDGVLRDTWTREGWKFRAENYIDQSVRLGRKNTVPFIDAYRLILGIRIGMRGSSEQNIIIGALTPETRAKTNKAVEIAKAAKVEMEPPTPIALREIDLHGNTVEEAIPIVDKFLKECYRDNVRRIRIIHGKGIFVLQKAIREYLRTHKYVKSESISSAAKDYGGEGSTEAKLVEFPIDKLN